MVPTPRTTLRLRSQANFFNALFGKKNRQVCWESCDIHKKSVGEVHSHSTLYRWLANKQ